MSKMMVSEVISGTSREAEKKYGDDAYWLKACGEWQINRSEQQKLWAADHIKWMWGTLETRDKCPATDALDRMEQIQEMLASIEPKTALLARELLKICVAILAHPDPDSRLAHGPVLEIVRNVAGQLDWLPGDFKLKPE